MKGNVENSAATGSRAAGRPKDQRPAPDDPMMPGDVSESRLQTILAHAPALVAVTQGPDHLFVLANPNFESLISRGSLAGRTVREVVPELVTQGVLAALDDVYATGVAFDGKERRLLLPREGDPYEGWYNVVYQPLKNVGGETTGILMHAVEVTDQVRARAEVEAARSELATRAATLAAILDSIPDAVYVGTIDGITTANRPALEQLGYTSLSQLNRNVSELAEELQNRDAETGERLEIADEPFTRASVKGERVVRDVLIRHRQTGEDRIVRSAAAPVIVDGLVVSAVAINTDVTDVRRAAAERERLLTAERAARAEAEAERERAEGILESMQEGHCVLDHEFRFVSVNSTMERYVNMARADMLGHTIWELFPGTVGTIFEQSYRQAASGKDVHFTHDYSDGRLELVCDVDAYPGPDGGVAIFWRDITARAQVTAERERLLVNTEAARVALAASEARHRSLAEAVPVQVWTSQPSGQLDFVSEQTAAYFGVTPEVLLGSGWGAYVHPDDISTALGRWSHALATGTPYQTEFRLRCAETGEFRWHLARAVPDRDEAGHIVGWVGSNTDVQGERAARAEAEAANQAKGEFLAVMSHELRTPLNAIGGYAELMELGLRGPVTDEQRSDLNRIQQSQKHLLGLINQVLNYTRVETGTVRYDMSDVSVATSLATAEALIVPQVRAKGLAYAFGECDPALTVRADPDKVQQIMLNLLTNAIKFTNAGGRVTVICTSDSSHVSVSVTDTGVGIAPDKLSMIFEPFIQVDAKLTRTQEGVGLGLAISRDLARGMKGDITAASTMESGSTFTLRLPRH